MPVPLVPAQDDQKFSALAMLLSGMGRKAPAAPAPTPSGANPTAMAPATTGMGSTADLESRVMAGNPTAVLARNPGIPDPPQAPNLDPLEKMHQELVQKLNGPMPDAKDYQPRWWQRLGQGMALFGSGMTHNPAFAETAEANIARPFNNAVASFKAQREGTEAQIKGVDEEIGQKRQSYDESLKGWHAQIDKSKEERGARYDDARAKKAEAEANYKDYKSMTVSDRAHEWPEVKSQLEQAGVKLTDDDAKQFLVNGEIPKPAKQADGPKSVQEGLYSKDPETRKRSEGFFHEEHRPKGDPADKPKKPMSGADVQRYTSQKDRAIKSAKSDYETQLAAINGSKKLKEDDKKAEREKLKDQYLDAWQTAQDGFEQSIKNAGYEPGEHYDVRANVDENLRTKPQGAKPSTQSTSKMSQSMTDTTVREPAKQAARADVQAYADKKGIPYSKAESAFKAKGYAIK
jgi:hypothetical protein